MGSIPPPRRYYETLRLLTLFRLTVSFDRFRPTDAVQLELPWRAPDARSRVVRLTAAAGNLFMVFGEPDVEIKKQKNGQIIVEIKGVDVYDPTTGQIRSASTDDIACWFIDSNYNSESFFVRHAYFTGTEEPYDKLKRTLRAEIDEAAWSSLYSTVSRPFDKTETGKFAVKVINHYGDEVLKVFQI